jgi:hypothetical protein
VAKVNGAVLGQVTGVVGAPAPLSSLSSSAITERCGPSPSLEVCAWKRCEESRADPRRGRVIMGAAWGAGVSSLGVRLGCGLGAGVALFGWRRGGAWVGSESTGQWAVIE